MTTTPSFWGSLLVISNDTAAGDASIAALSNGDFSIAFSTNTPTSGLPEYDIHARLITAGGSLLPGDIVSNLASNNGNDLYSPEIVELNNGTLAITFVSEYSSTDHDPSYVLRSPPGFNDSTSISGLDLSPLDDVALYETVKTNSGFATLYGRDNQTVLLRRFDSSGTLIGNTISVDNSTDSQHDADLTSLTNGDLVVTWRTFNSTTLTSTLWLRLFDASGVAVTSRFSFANTPNAGLSNVEALESGGFVAVWQDVTDGGIYHQRFDENGLAVGNRIFDPAGFSIAPKITSLSDGGYIIGWSDYNRTEGDGSPDGSITLQRYSAVGMRVGHQLIIDHPGDQSLYDLKELSDGRVVITYASETGDSTNQTRLLARIIDPRDNHIEGSLSSDIIYGREDYSHIIGFSGSDKLFGRAGDDILMGGAGNDTLNGGAGTDVLNGGVGRDRMIGGAGNDTLLGGTGTDVINGGVGHDRMIGGAGNDTLVGGTGNDVINGGVGRDRMIGGAGSDTLVGGTGNDALNGGVGRDRIIGGAGADKMSGYHGADVFVFTSMSDSTTRISGRDTILDFGIKHDLIDVRAIDANTNRAGNQAFSYIGDSAFTGQEGELSAKIVARGTLVSGDINGDRIADFSFLLDDPLALTANYFIL